MHMPSNSVASICIASAAICALGVLPAEASSSASASQQQLRGDVGSSSISIRNPRILENGRLVTANVYWNQGMINQPGAMDRFSIRLVAIGARSKTTLLHAKATTHAPSAINTVRIRLSKAKAKKLRNVGNVALAATQQYGLGGTHNGLYFQQQVTVVKLKTDGSIRWGHRCANRQIRPGKNVTKCNLVGANLSNADLTSVNLRGANLSGGSIAGSSVRHAKFQGANLTGTDLHGTSGVPANGSIQPVSRQVVTYLGNGNTGGTAPSAGRYLAGSTVTVSGNTGSLVRQGYAFAGWNTAADGSGTSYSPASTFPMPASAVTLYAQWVSVYSFTFVNRSGEYLASNAIPVMASWPCIDGTCEGTVAKAATDGEITTLTELATAPSGSATVTFSLSPYEYSPEAYTYYPLSVDNGGSCSPDGVGGNAGLASFTCTITATDTTITMTESRP